MVQRVPLGAILGVLGVVWAVQGVPLGVILGVLGYPWGNLARSRRQDPPPQISGAPFQAILELKGGEKGTKMKPDWIFDRFRERF